MIKGKIYEGVLTFGIHKGRRVLLKFIKDTGVYYYMEVVQDTVWGDVELEDWKVGEKYYIGYDSYIFTPYSENLENV